MEAVPRKRVGIIESISLDGVCAFSCDTTWSNCVSGATYYLRECTDRENLPVDIRARGALSMRVRRPESCWRSSVLVQGPWFGGRRGVAKQAFEVRVQEYSFGIQIGPQTQKIIPARISRGQLSGRHCVHLAPVRAPLMLLEDFFDCREV